MSTELCPMLLARNHDEDTCDWCRAHHRWVDRHTLLVSYDHDPDREGEDAFGQIVDALEGAGFKEVAVDMQDYVAVLGAIQHAYAAIYEILDRNKPTSAELSDVQSRLAVALRVFGSSGAEALGIDAD